ncbi:MAG: hypothetical protein KKG59_05165, partial [Nanoarchaeota archaeon]|nr:hypothetical protein [Nanoarchaeota archaeon]
NVILENVGEHNVEAIDVQAEIVGIEPTLFNVAANQITIEQLDMGLRGASKLPDGTSVPGDPTTLFFPTDEGTAEAFAYLPNLMGTDEILLRAELCYKYMTYSTTHICIKDNVLDNLQSDKICSVSEDKMPQNSGAPIHISSVRQMPQGKHNSVVIFTVEHVGSGLFFNPHVDDSIDAECNDILHNPDENVVWVEAYFDDVGGSYVPPEIHCGVLRGQAAGKVHLFQGEPREISCTIYGDGTQSRIYQDLLHIDLTYQYLSFLETPLIVRDMKTEDYDWEP